MCHGKCDKEQKLEEPKKEDVRLDRLEDQQTMFLPTDAILMVEKKPFHLNKNCLLTIFPSLIRCLNQNSKRTTRKLFRYLGRCFIIFSCFYIRFIFLHLYV